MKISIPTGERSKVLVKLLEREIVERETSLATLAAELELIKGHQQEILEMEKEYSNEGLDNQFRQSIKSA